MYALINGNLRVSPSTGPPQPNSCDRSRKDSEPGVLTSPFKSFLLSGPWDSFIQRERERRGRRESIYKIGSGIEGRMMSAKSLLYNASGKKKDKGGIGSLFTSKFPSSHQSHLA